MVKSLVLSQVACSANDAHRQSGAKRQQRGPAEHTTARADDDDHAQKAQQHGHPVMALNLFLQENNRQQHDQHGRDKRDGACPISGLRSVGYHDKNNVGLGCRGGGTLRGLANKACQQHIASRLTGIAKNAETLGDEISGHAHDATILSVALLPVRLPHSSPRPIKPAVRPGKPARSWH